MELEKIENQDIPGASLRAGSPRHFYQSICRSLKHWRGLVESLGWASSEIDTQSGR